MVCRQKGEEKRRSEGGKGREDGDDIGPVSLLTPKEKNAADVSSERVGVVDSYLDTVAKTSSYYYRVKRCLEQSYA